MSSYCVLFFKKWIIGWGFEASLDNGISVEYYQKKKKKRLANKKGTSLSVTIILWKRDLTFENCSWCRENEKMFCLAGD